MSPEEARVIFFALLALINIFDEGPTPLTCYFRCRMKQISVEGNGLSGYEKAWPHDFGRTW